MLDFISTIQERIVTDDSRIKKILGCAGSRKTDTMIKCGLHPLRQTEDYHVIYLTLVGSVTDEITRRMEKMLSIYMYQYGMSNHYLGTYKNNSIEIANYDAFIHYQLQRLDYSLYSVAQDYEKKTQMLLEAIQNGNVEHFYLKNGEKASMILVDEFQDMSHDKVKVLIDFFQRNPHTRLAVFGDMLQTIFPHAIQQSTHPLILMDELHPTVFHLNICYRCPKSHIEVVNCIMEESQRLYQTVPIQHHYEIAENKPLFFCHDLISTQRGSFHTANQLFQMIQRLLQLDPSIQYSDIAIIMKKSNHQYVFQYLYQLFKKNQLEASISYSKTKTVFNERIPIDWIDNQDKLKMLSIHGDKGKGHKVIFFLGFSGNVIPEERHYYKMDEILSHSLLNVALTRSTRYLLIGMTRLNPSHYFIRKYKELKSLSYYAWERIDNPFFATLATYTKKETPFLSRSSIRTMPLLTPIKNIIHLQTEDNLSKLFKTLHCQKIQLGFSFSCHEKEDRLYLYNTMAKLLFIRHTNLGLYRKLWSPYVDFYQTKRISYQHDLTITSFVKDARLNVYAVRNPTLWFESIKHLPTLSFSEPHLILQSCFQDEFFKTLEKSFQEDTETDGFNFLFFWKLSIFYNEYLDHVFVPSLLSHYHNPPDLFQPLYHNLQEYISYLKNSHSKYHIQFQQSISCVQTIEDPQELSELGFQEEIESDRIYYTDGYKYGITSSIDFYETIQRILIEFSMSRDVIFNRLYQSLLHSYLFKQYQKWGKIHGIHVYDLQKGQLYTISNTHSYNYKQIMSQLLEHYQFPSFFINRLV